MKSVKRQSRDAKTNKAAIVSSKQISWSWIKDKVYYRKILLRKIRNFQYYTHTYHNNLNYFAVALCT